MENLAPCTHTDGYGSTIIFIEGRPSDGVCILCNKEFPMLRLVENTAPNECACTGCACD